MLGRVMSLVALAMVGLAPISQAAAGALIKLSVQGMFATSGAGTALVAAFVFTQRNRWEFPPAEQAGDDTTAAPLAEPVSELGAA